MATNRALATRSIFVRIIPRPANLAESREIMRVLKRFGEISMFKAMKYEYQRPLPNLAVVIYQDSHAAQAAMDASPIRFALEQDSSNESDLEQAHSASADHAAEDEDKDEVEGASEPPSDNIDDILRPSQLLSHTLTFPSVLAGPPPSPPTPMPFDSTATTHPRTVRHKPFLVTVERSHVVHADYIERQPYYKQFHPMQSVAHYDLANQVPHPGLSDVSKRPPNAFRTPVRVLQTMSHYVERVMPSLKKISEGNNERIDLDFEQQKSRREQ